MNYVNFIRKHIPHSIGQDVSASETTSSWNARSASGNFPSVRSLARANLPRTLPLSFSPSRSLHRQTWPCENVNDINSEPNGDYRSRERTQLSALASARASTVPSEPVRVSSAAHTRRPQAEGMPTLRKPTAIPLTSLDEESHFRWIFTSSSSAPPRELPPAPRTARKRSIFRLDS